MFTGIIQYLGQVRRGEKTSAGRRFDIELGPLAEQAKRGDSISINGVCLTVTETTTGVAAFDVIPETLNCSTLGGLKTGDRVNAEASLRAADRLDGHFVQGHVDAIATVDRIDKSDGAYHIWFAADEPVLRYIVPKGSVALDGVSMTVADLEPGRFWVALIPTTLRETTLGLRQPGDTVNLETDILVRTVAHLLQHRGAPQKRNITMDMLREHGFADVASSGGDAP